MCFFNSLPGGGKEGLFFFQCALFGKKKFFFFGFLGKKNFLYIFFRKSWGGGGFY